MNIIKRLTLLFFLTRPVVLIPVWGFALFGFRLASEHDLAAEPLGVKPFLMIVIFSISVAAVYLLNQREDFLVDSDNGGYPLMVKSGISLKLVNYSVIILAVLSAAIPLILKSVPLAVLSVISLLIGWLYSCRPAYFTGKPVMDFVSNGIGFGGAAFAAGWFLAGGSLSAELIRSAVPYVLLMFAGSISSTLPDMEGDRKHGKITTAVKIGADRAHTLASFFLAAGSLAGAFNSDFAAVLCGVLAAPFYLLHLLKPTQKSMELCYKAGGGFMMLIIAVTYPLFGAVSFLVGVITFFYFKIVHKVNYPSLLPTDSQ